MKMEKERSEKMEEEISKKRGEEKETEVRRGERIER